MMGTRHNIMRHILPWAPSLSIIVASVVVKDKYIKTQWHLL
jgi:hypothetical protein